MPAQSFQRQDLEAQLDRARRNAKRKARCLARLRRLDQDDEVAGLVRDIEAQLGEETRRRRALQAQLAGFSVADPKGSEVES